MFFSEPDLDAIKAQKGKPKVYATQAGSRLYTASELARELGVTRQAVNLWIQKGAIQPVAVRGKRQLFSTETLDQMRKERE